MKKLRPWIQQIVLSLCVSGASLADAASQPNAVVAWGYNADGETNVPPALANVAAIAGGGYHSLVLQSNGTVVAWGQNGYGQTTVPAGLTNVAAIAGGGFHSLALQSNGAVVAWGYNGYGQTSVPPGLTNVAAIAGGGYHSLALQSNGIVVAWGHNAYGQTSVPPGLSNVTAVAGGGYHSLALQSNGMVAAWGHNLYGQVTVPAGLSNVTAIAAGFYHSLALQSNGTVVAWGYNGYGQVLVPPELTNVVAIAAGGYHNLALLSDGTVVAWGYNGYGETNVPPGLSDVAAIAGGLDHSLAIAPLLVEPPPAVSLALGGDTNLSVTVWFGSPFSCQWSLNGIPLAGATGTSLLISNFDLTAAGLYSVAITSQFRSAILCTDVRLTNSPIVLVDGVDVGGGAVSRTNVSQITMTSTFGPDAEIYYTLDGSDPDFAATPYSGAFTLTNSATIRAIAYNFAYSDWAEAASISLEIIPLYPLSASSPGGGSIITSPLAYDGGILYVSNTVVTLTAMPSIGWSFAFWTGDSSDATNVTTVVMDQPRTVQALFDTSLTLLTNGSGQVLLNPAAGPYLYGSTVQLTALPSPGYYFFGWANAASGFANPLLFTVTNSTPGITALFAALKPSQLSLTVLPEGNGTVLINPARNVYTNGETMTLTAVPASDSLFTGWSGDAAGGLNPLVLALDSNKLIMANFAVAPVFQTVMQSAGTVTFAWTAVMGQTYQAQYKTNLLQTNWSSLGSPNLATNDIMSASDSTGPDRQRFYRVIPLP